MTDETAQLLNDGWTKHHLLYWRPQGIFGGMVSEVIPSEQHHDGVSFIVCPNCETAKWEVHMSIDGLRFARMDDRSWHTRTQAMDWAEGADV